MHVQDEITKIKLENLGTKNIIYHEKRWTTLLNLFKGNNPLSAIDAPAPNTCDCGKEKHGFSHHVTNCPANE